MTEYELDQICSRIDCDCNCMKCQLFAENINEELGMDEYDDADDYEDDEGYEEMPYEFSYEALSDIF